MLNRVVMLTLFFAGGTASAQEMSSDQTKDFTVEAGARYFASTGKSDYELYGDSTPTRKFSSIQHSGEEAHAGELYFRGDHKSGLFVKGYSGIGKIREGKTFDEDFPLLPQDIADKLADTPGLDEEDLAFLRDQTYSKTRARTKGHLKYAVLDVGYTFLDTGGLGSETPVRLAGFVGYGHWNQKFKSMGCKQVGSAGSDLCRPPNDVPANVHSLTEVDWFNGVRLGMAGDVRLGRKMKISAEAAYLFARHKTFDRHPLRTDLPPEYAKGHGEGHQVELVMSYDIDPRVSLGVGGRWWHVGSRVALQTKQLEAFSVDRYGAFLQIGFKL